MTPSEYINRELAKARRSLEFALRRPGVTDYELDRLEEKVAVLEELEKMIGGNNG